MDVPGPLEVVRRALPTLRGRRVVDIGCGEGGFAGQLASAGATVIGIDPNPEAVAVARRSVPGCRFEIAGAEALPFDDGSFDLAVIFNALHHVPETQMRQALSEASRCLVPDGRLVVIEPDASGSFFEVVKLVDDETAVRARARDVLRDAVAAGELAIETTLTFVRRETFSDVSGVLRRLAAVDPARAAAVGEKLDQIRDTFTRVSEPRGEARELMQPHWACVLRPLPRAEAAEGAVLLPEG